MFTIMWYTNRSFYIIRRNKMKKIALLLAVLLLAFTLCACSDTTPKDDTTTPNDVTEEPSTNEALVEEFLKNVTVEKAPETEAEKDDTPMAEAFDIPYQYDLTPYVTLNREDYIGLELTRMSADVTKEALLEAVNADLENFGEEIEVTDRGAEMGDNININFKGFESGVAFSGGTAENYDMVLGEAGFIDGFEDQLVGHKTGEEFTIDVVFPEDYAENLAGKPAQFEIKINSIKKIELPELTDEFAKTNFACDTANDYLLQKYKELHALNLSQVDNAQKSLAYSMIYEKADFTALPEDRYDLYAATIRSDIEGAASFNQLTVEEYVTQNGLTMEQYEEYVDSQASTIVEQELIAYSIANNEGLLKDVTKTDYNKYLIGLSASYGTDSATFENTYGSEMIWNSFVLEIAIQHVLDNAATK